MKTSPRYKQHRFNCKFFLIILVVISTGLPSCGWVHNLFGPKYGCPSDGKNVGAERILSGEKVPKAPKFKA